MATNPVDRFLTKFVRAGDDECWTWTAGRANGYGQFYAGSRIKTYAHRFAYQLWVATIPDGLEIDHLCRNRACVNPAHLEAVTHAENRRRSIGFPVVNKRDLGTTCKAGHPRTPENTGTNNRNARFCRPCQRAAVVKTRLSSRR